MSDNRVAVVTGGSGGIGRACGTVLATQGYDVVLTSRRPEPLEEAAAEIGGRGVPADAASEDDVQRLFDEAGRCDLLVHAAGILEGTTVREQSVAVFDDVMRINLRSSYLVTQAALARMEAGGRIIYVSSVAGLKGLPKFSAYSSSKAGLNALAQSVAAEVEADGINVHVLVPATVDTAMIDDPRTLKGGGVLTPEHVADVVGWLAQLPPAIVIRQIIMRATHVGPFVPGRSQ